MKIVSIDLEATAGDSSYAQMLEFAAVGFDISTPFKPVTFHRRFTLPTSFRCQLTALIINAELLQNIHDYENNRLQDSEAVLYRTAEKDLFQEFFQWTIEEDLAFSSDEGNSLAYQINVAGKNFPRYDQIILNRNNDRWSDFISRRYIEVAPFYILPHDITTPKTQEVKRRSGLFADSIVSHNALTDAGEVALMTYNKLSKA